MDFTKVKENLIRNGYSVSEFDTAEDAAQYLDEQIDGKTVGFGGSVTIHDKMKLYELLGEHNEVASHWKPVPGKTREEIINEEQSSEIYLSSVNGLSETGEIVNIDGTCNRIAAITFGHEKVYLVAGENKITPDLESAITRARNIAAPLNARRLNKKTPCAVNADKCYDCSSPDRICKGLSVFWKCPGGQSTEVVLIHEKLGY
ncbi:MAG: lactate utilization protein [Parasporobacterium sp.]|nr:lactate utilization protein [Parasporobacterium sp.]